MKQQKPLLRVEYTKALSNAVEREIAQLNCAEHVRRSGYALRLIVPTHFSFRRSWAYAR